MKSFREVLKRQAYESPHVEIIEIESQGAFCTSGGQATPGITGDGGIHFGDDTGQW